MRQRPFISIASVLIRRTVLLSLACMVLVFAIQGWWLQKDHERQLESVLTDVAQTSVPLLAVGLWDIEIAAVKAQVEQIAKRPGIGYVRLRATGSQTFEAGEPALSGAAVSRRLTLHSPRGDTPLGELELMADPAYLWSLLWQSALPILGGYGILTAAICLMMAVVLRRLLQRPLSSIAAFATQVTPQDLTTQLHLPPRQQSHVDEIDLLEEAIGKLQAGLRDHIGNLDSLVAERTAQLEKLLGEIRHLSMTDGLTGAFNRRTLEERLPGEIERAHRYGRSLSVIFIDLDHFKQINDTHGHAVGDDVLRLAAQCIQASLRQGVDWMVRYGGEEFVVVLPETDLQAATRVAGRLCQALPLVRMHAGTTGFRITASFGVSTGRPGEDSTSLLARTDALVYQAKAHGRHRVVSAA